MKTVIKKEFIFSEDESKIILSALNYFIKNNPHNKHIKVYQTMAELIKAVLEVE